MNLVLWNVEGLRSLLGGGVVTFFEKFDMLLLTETFQLKPSSIPGFYSFDELAVKLEKGRPMGGITVAVRAEWRPKPIFRSEHMVGVEILSGVVYCAYFSPTCEVLDIVDHLAERLCLMDLSKQTLIAGDFNARIDAGRSMKTEAIVDLMEDFGFSLISCESEPTYLCHNGSSVIDLVFVNFPGCRVATEHAEKCILLKKHLPVKVKVPSQSPAAHAQLSTCPSRRRLVAPDELTPEWMNSVETLLGQLDLDAATVMLTTGILEVAPLNIPKRLEFGLKRDPTIDRQKWLLINLHKKVLKNPALLSEYAVEKKKLKALIAERKQLLWQREEERKIAEAESTPWSIKPKRWTTMGNQIPLDVWEDHFSRLYDPQPFARPPHRDHDYLDPVFPVRPIPHVDHDYLVEDWSGDLGPECFADVVGTEELNADFSEEEVFGVLRTCSDKKAAGTDLLCNEHIKGSWPVVGYLWVLLFNLIMFKGEMVQSWRSGKVNILYKGKGEPLDPNSYRGITLLSHVCKLFSKCVAKRMMDYVETKSLPDEQYGFRHGRSTGRAFNILKDFVKVSDPSPVYAIFVDFRKAFDMVPRIKLLKKLALFHNVKGRMLKVVASMLSYNVINVSDGVAQSKDIIQVRGVMQGDSLSPLLFILFVADLPQLLKDDQEIVESVMFADDLVFFSKSRGALQRCLNKLSQYCYVNSLEVNLGKTKAVKFRRGGNLCVGDRFFFNGELVQFVNSYEYLGILVQSRWVFTKHLLKKRLKASAATFMIKNLQKISLEAALKYFEVMIKPIAVYGIECFWSDLSVAQFEILDGAFFDFLKKVLGLHRSTRNRLVLMMCGFPLLSESLVMRGRVEETPAYRAHLNNFYSKCAEVDEEFFGSPAMVQSEWKKSNYDKRHLVCRVSVHGFHSKICTTEGQHDRGRDCVCFFCHECCKSLLHVLVCPVVMDIGLGFFDTM